MAGFGDQVVEALGGLPAESLGVSARPGRDPSQWGGLEVSPSSSVWGALAAATDLSVHPALGDGREFFEFSLLSDPWCHLFVGLLLGRQLGVLFLFVFRRQPAAPQAGPFCFLTVAVF